MSKVIRKKICAIREAEWFLANVRFVNKATLRWSRSTHGSRVYIKTGFLAQPEVEVATFRGEKHQEIELPAVPCFNPCRLRLCPPPGGKATVFIELDVDMADEFKREPQEPKYPVIRLQSIGEAKTSNDVVLAEDFVEIPPLHTIEES